MSPITNMQLHLEWRKTKFSWAGLSAKLLASLHSHFSLQKSPDSCKVKLIPCLGRLFIRKCNSSVSGSRALAPQDNYLCLQWLKQMGGNAKISLVVAPWRNSVPLFPTFYWTRLDWRLTAIPGDCDKGSDSWNLGTGFRAGATILCRAALCALLFTSSCIQFAESWFNIFTQRERE